MSSNIYQIYTENPIISNATDDLMYFGQSPYGTGNDAAMTYGSFSSQFVPINTAVLLNATGMQVITGAGLEMPSLTTPLIATTPPDSSDSSLTLGTAYRNILGYDAVYTIYLDITSASLADIMLGVGINSSPTQQTLISSFSTITETIVPITIYLPNAYYALLSTSGTISVSISGQQAMPV